jgi:cytochrome c556
MRFKIVPHLLNLVICLILANTTYADSEATEKRQQIYSSIDDQSEILEDLVDDQLWQQAAPIAVELANKVAQLNTLFPESSKDEGRAKDAIWEEWEEFSQRLHRLESDFRSVSNAIAANDHKQAQEHLEMATSACRACHRNYRSLW